MFVVLFLAASMAGFYLLNANYGSAVSFQQYEPSYLPDNIRVTSRTIEIWPKDGDSILRNKILRIGFSHTLFDLGETKVSALLPGCDWPVVPINATCSMQETSNHQRYRLMLTFGGSETKTPFEQEVRLFKNGTYIWISARGTPLEPYSVETWNKIIDSLAPTSYHHLPVEYSAPGP